MKENKTLKEEHSSSVATKFIEVIPKILWVMFSALVLWLFYPQIKYDILPNLTSFKFGEFEATIRNDLSAISDKDPGKDFNRYISTEQRDLIIQRSHSLYRKLDNTRLLWVDSNVDGNTDIRKILKLWGVSVDCAKSDDEAYQYLRNSSIDNGYYSLIITNNHHIEGSGVNFSDNVRRDFPELDIPVILFSSSYGGDSIRIHGVPKNIFAATNRYDYLFHFIFDVLERGNAPYPANIERYLQDT